VNSEIKRITGKALPQNEIDAAFANMNITYDPLADSLLQSADRAYALGFLGKSKPDLTGLYNLGLLNTVLTGQGLATISGPTAK
jgi:NitT/TauT family transport system substrate-binding protein